MIKREDIPKIIKILQDKYDNSKDGDIIYDLNLVSPSKSYEEFKLPKNWQVQVNENMKDNNLIHMWRGHSWSNAGYIQQDGIHSLLKWRNCKLLSMEEFIEHVYNKTNTW